MIPRTIDPSRRSMPFQEWPETDKTLWLQATRSNALFGESGKARHWRPRTQKTNIQAYGRFLGYLAWKGQLVAETSPAKRADLKTLVAYYDHISGFLALASQLSLLVGLKVTLQAMHTEIDWRWLQDACNRLQTLVAAERRTRPRLPSTVGLARLIQIELAEAQTGLGEGRVKLNDATRFRDALVLALLLRRPLRTRNLSDLRIGHDFRREGTTWAISIPGQKTKNGAPIKLTFPDEIVEAMNCYLERVRPCFPGAATCPQLWLCKLGVHRDPLWLYHRVVRLTARLTGKPINPHLFRSMAATLLAEDAPDDELAASALLAHKHLSTTVQFYIRATEIKASWRINTLLDLARRSPR